MKNYNTLSLFTLFLLTCNLIKPEGEAPTNHPYEKLFDENISKDKIFKEEEFDNLKDLRAHTQEHTGLSWKNWAKSKLAFAYTDDAKIRAVFNTDRIPVLTENDINAFKKLDPADQLEYINEWSSWQLKNVLEERSKLIIRRQKEVFENTEKLKELKEKSDNLTKELNKWENPHWLTRFMYKQEEINVMQKKLTNEIEQINRSRGENQQSTEKTIAQLEEEKNQAGEDYKKKLKEFMNALDPLLNGKVLRFNRDTQKFELHKKNVIPTKPTEQKNSDTRDSYFKRPEKTNPTDYTGTPRDKVQQQVTQQEVDELQKKFENLITTANINPPSTKNGTHNLTQNEIEQRDQIETTMKRELDEIVQKFKQNKITLETANQESEQAIARAIKEAQQKNNAEMQRKVIAKSKIEFVDSSS
jgi:hypothetical protein